MPFRRSRGLDPAAEGHLPADGPSLPSRLTPALAGVVVLAAVIVAVLTVSVMRVSRVAVDHRGAATHTVRALWVVWIICAVLGVEIVPGEPIAAQTTAALAYDDLRQVSTDLRDRQPFEQEVATDAYRGTPGPLLLNGLRGKDVMFTFVESYGRDVVQGSDLAQKVDAVLDDGTNQLRAAGFGSRSAFLTSSTTGGGSWLAHSTLQSGLKIDNQQRYNDLLASDRFTLGGAFKRAGWKTVWDVPAHTQDWPEGKKFYG